MILIADASALIALSVSVIGRTLLETVLELAGESDALRDLRP